MGYIVLRKSGNRYFSAGGHWYGTLEAAEAAAVGLAREHPRHSYMVTKTKVERWAKSTTRRPAERLGRTEP